MTFPYVILIIIPPLLYKITKHTCQNVLASKIGEFCYTSAIDIVIFCVYIQYICVRNAPTYPYEI